ncbi:MAG: ABC transporter ATP-binding protein [Betaproteobacteria bacterium]|nr:ABC transporter ATP-binding protein [Betaproteobacteria bacterium]MDH5221629.1 ABC transporter ATP-binding protein [Betaproteobacteria bacterium]MDH5351997.1 ABC transporter ATP-binding protein [Betaproteobacteria bacterium]
MSALLQVAGLAKRFGGFTALEGIALDVAPGERLGLIGPNGSGKTTLINCISGALYNDEGRIAFEGRDITRLPPFQRARLGIARSFQIPKPFRSLTVLDNLRVPLEYAARTRSAHRRAEDEAMRVLESMGLAARAHQDSAGLTQVDMRKLELARAMAAHPRLLISDEAMAGLSGAEVDEVLEILFKLNAAGITIIMIEHIMQAVMRFSQRVVCLDAGRIICEGTPEQTVANADVQRAYLGA